MTADRSELCDHGRRWLDELPPCLDPDAVLAALGPAMAAWHAENPPDDEDTPR